MDYSSYIEQLRVYGLSEAQIHDELAKQGLSQQQINSLMQTTARPVTTTTAQPATPAASGAPPSAQPPSPQPLQPAAEAYMDYMKALLAQGMTPDAVDQDLASHGVDQNTRKTLFEVLAQTILPKNYPAPSLQRAGAMGQAPIKIETTAEKTTKAVAAKPPNALKGWIITIICCLVPTLFIMFDAPGRFANGTHTLLTLGDIFAVIGLVLLAIDLILATRMSGIENLFGGLNKVYVAHAIIGSAAFAAILVHPTLIALRYAPLGYHTVAGFFIPNPKYLASAFGIVALAMVIILLAVTFYVRLPYKLWLATHKYLGVAYLLISIHVLFSPNVITDNLFVRLYLIVLVIAGLAAFTYRTLLPNVFTRRYLYIVQAATEKAKGVIELTMTPTTKAIRFQAGQFIFISFKSDGLSPEWHPFTVVSSPKSKSLSIDIKSLGGYTETMTRLLPKMVGMSAFIEGAYGRFSFRNFRNLNQVWIAGGIGITPFLSMAQNLGKGPYNIDLYYSVKSEAELIDLDKLMQEQTNQPDKVFRVIPFVTDKYNRFLTADIINATTSHAAKRDFLLCGPPPMMHAMKEQLQRLGVKKYRIHSEEFSIL